MHDSYRGPNISEIDGFLYSHNKTSSQKFSFAKVVLLSKLGSPAKFHAQGRRHDFFRVLNIPEVDGLLN